ncbi:PaaX family transcriptional regulator [Nakamurella silvestris]|nr:PaaX family transcriptional regulator [Nakamurella silvestris]
MVSFAGSYLREIGGWISVGDLITLLAAADIGEPAVRQALVRLKSRGFLESEKRGTVAGYRLTADGLKDLERGDRRIFRRGEADPDAGWVLAVFSVPENARAQRHRLRAQLGWLGFGTVSSGVWVAPGSLADLAREMLAEADLGQYVTWFTGHHLGEVDVASWWDLAELAVSYQEFLRVWRSRAASADPLGPAEAFGRYLPLVDGWRLFPRLDPGLPARVLPTDWPGREAWEVFDTLHRRWYVLGREFVEATVAHQPQ